MALFSHKKQEELRREAEAQEAQRIEREKQEQEAEARRLAEEKRKQAKDMANRLMANAKAAYKNKDYAATIKYLDPLVKAGIPEAQCIMGQLYSNGYGVEEDDAKAASLYRLAAEKGVAVACSNLAKFYATGKGVGKDLYEALKWAEQAKTAGSVKADSLIAAIRNDISSMEAKAVIEKSKAEFPGDKYSLQELYNLSIKFHSTCEYEKSLGLFLRLAARGVNQSELYCGAAYTAGEGTTKNETIAAHWYEKSANHGNVDAQFICGAIYQNGEGVAQDIKKALYWYEKAGEQGNAQAQHQCATFYLNGCGEDIKPDNEKAIYWLEKSAESGDKNAPALCAMLYSESGNYEKALYWNTKATELGDAQSQYLCGLMCSAKRNEAEALCWFEKAAEQGYAEAQYECGRYYYTGTGTSLDFEKALEWFKKAAGQGHTKAQLLCSEMYASGKGTPRHIGMARIWATKVARQTEDLELQKVAKDALIKMQKS